MLTSKLLLSTALASLASTALAFPAQFELSSLNGKNGFQITGEAVEDESGYSVSSAGDVNGDGFGDVIIGAVHADPRGRDSGASYVVFGRKGGFPAEFKLSQLNGVNGFQINGEQVDDYSDGSVAGAGDINGDGFDDVIIGAARANPNDARRELDRAGASYVIFGKAGRFAPNINVSSLNGANGFKISGEEYFAGSGGSVASAGDLNGDGMDDIIIGARYSQRNGASSGASYVIFGARKFGANLNLSSLNGANGFQINGEGFRDLSGSSVASAGDVNGDGIDDVVIGAASAGGTNDFVGASYVLFGRRGRYAANFELSRLDGKNGFQINGEAAGDVAAEVASAGDVNGDGLDDLIIGAEGAEAGQNTGYAAGASYVVFGRRQFPANLSLSRLNGLNGFQLTGEKAFDRSGTSVASAGDINGDGFDDILIGANFADPGGPQSGTAYLVFGKAGRFPANLPLSDLNGKNGFELAGEALADYAGNSVSTAGDVNGDGFADFIIGASRAELTASGASYVIFGRATGPINRTGTAADETITGGPFNDRLNGAAGNDRIFGNGGDDVLTGGPGIDILSGGAGRDLFVLNRAGESPFPTTLFDSQRPRGYDRIVDFERGKDRVDLRRIDADGNPANGNQAFVFLGTGSFTGAGGEVMFRTQTSRTTSTILYGDIDGDRVGDFAIRIDRVLSLSRADVLL